MAGEHVPMFGRDAPGVIEAFAIGAVACPLHKGVHVDLADENGRVIATGFLPFDAWILLTGDVENDIEDMVKQGVAGR